MVAERAHPARLRPASLAALESGIVTFTVQITSTTADATVITNTAVIGDDGTNGPDKTPGDNSAQDTTTVTFAKFDITKQDTGVIVAAGQNITYAIYYTNTSGVDANNVVITETIPQNTTFVSTGNTSATWSCPDGTLAIISAHSLTLVN